MKDLHIKKLKSILIIDDDITSSFITCNLLKRHNIAESITCVKNGKEALANILTEPPEVIFLDLFMPVMNGFEFLDSLSVQLPDYVTSIKIFILSSSLNRNQINKTSQYGIEGYIEKPLNIDRLKKLTFEIYRNS